MLNGLETVVRVRSSCPKLCSLSRCFYVTNARTVHGGIESWDFTVDHGRRKRNPPQNLEYGTLMQIPPP